MSDLQSKIQELFLEKGDIKDGKMFKEELQRVCVEIGMTADEVEVIFAEIDTDGDSVSVAAFMDWVFGDDAEADLTTPEDSVNECLIMDRYLVQGINDGTAFLGEGTFSMVWKARDIQTKKEVALKTYKVDIQNPSFIQKQFRHQVNVLKWLQVPVERQKVLDKNPELWHDMLDVASCFSLKLLDYSQNADGDPVPHSDGYSYVITEMGEYSLKDLIESKREANEKFTDDEIQFIASSCILCVAALHAKNLTHLDFKPENLLMCDGTWRVIDFATSVPIQDELKRDNTSISFTPQYCSPEYAKFLQGDDEYLKIEPSMDVWSIGLILCELVTFSRVISQENRRLLKATALNSAPAIIDWLSFKCSRGVLKLPPAIEEFNPNFLLALNSILIGEPVRRSTLAQMLKIPYFEQGVLKLSSSWGDTHKDERMKRVVARSRKKKITKRESKGILNAVFHGMLRKLISDGDPTREDHWRKRDFWITEHGALCHFSLKHDKPMVLINGADLRCVSFRVVDDVENLAHPNTFEIQLIKDHDEEAVWFAADSPEDIDRWIEAINLANSDTFNFEHMTAIRLKVNNKRVRVDDHEDDYKKMFGSQLWKLNLDGDPTVEEEWRLRDVWLTQNGSLCYYSELQQKPLQYHNASDMKRVAVQRLYRETIPECKLQSFAKAEVQPLVDKLKSTKAKEKEFALGALDNLYLKDGNRELIAQAGGKYADACCKDHAFTISLPSTNGMEYEPSVFAAKSEEECDQWIKEISKLNQGSPEAPLKNRLSAYM